MTNDPYQILGISKQASDKEIKAAYRKLAKQHHPDLNPDNKQAARIFGDISAAYDLLSNAEKRAAYDRGEINLQGEPTQQQFYRDFAQSPQGQRYRSHQHEFSQEDIENLFGGFFSGGMGGRKAGFKQQPTDAYYRVAITLREAVQGGKKQVTMPDGKVLNITIPAGVTDGQRLRLRGQGRQSSARRSAGDAFIDLFIQPDDYYRREGNHITAELPITLSEAVLGEKVIVPTLHGKVQVTIPRNSSSGTRLRIKGKGINGGDHFAILRIMLPPETDPSLETAIRDWAEANTYNPRNHPEFST